MQGLYYGLNWLMHSKFPAAGQYKKCQDSPLSIIKEQKRLTDERSWLQKSLFEKD